MQNIKIYLSTVPVLATLWLGSLAGLLIEINHFFPDALTFPFFFILINIILRIRKEKMMLDQFNPFLRG